MSHLPDGQQGYGTCDRCGATCTRVINYDGIIRCIGGCRESSVTEVTQRPTVHLHGSTSARPVCGAPIPEDRMAGLTAWRSDITCIPCIDTLRPVPGIAYCHRSPDLDHTNCPSSVECTQVGIGFDAEGNPAPAGIDLTRRSEWVTLPLDEV